MYERGVMIGGKDRQAPVDESIMPAASQYAYASTGWDQVGLTWADIINQENENAANLHRARQLHER
jgi:hypothetical protein